MNGTKKEINRELNKENIYFGELIKSQMVLDLLRGAISQKLVSKDYEVNAETLTAFAEILKESERNLGYVQDSYNSYYENYLK